MATYNLNGMEFEDIPGNQWAVRLTAVREPANRARVLTVPDRVNGKGVAEIGQAGCCDAKCESVILPKNRNSQARLFALRKFKEFYRPRILYGNRGGGLFRLHFPYKF